MTNWDDTLFWIVRHGSTEANDEDVYRSWSNAQQAQLSDKGRREVDDAAIYLKAIKAPVRIIIGDSLDRTMESAERIGYKLGATHFEYLRGLHPLNMGDYTLKPKKDHPVEVYMKNPEKRIPGGETRKEFDQRQQDTFRAIMELVGDEGVEPGSIVIVGHGSNVSYLHNEVYNPAGKADVTYEGLVNPGGAIQATRDKLKALTKVRSKATKE